MKYGCDCLLYVHSKMTWENATIYCQGMTGKLVAIRSDRMQRDIKRFLKAQLGSRGLARSRVYTGLMYTHALSHQPAFMGTPRAGHADGWYWQALDGVTPTPLDTGDFTHWAKGHPHPKDRVFKESCMHLGGADRLRWVSSHCTVPMNFICHFASVPRDLRHRSGKGGKCRHSGSRNRKKKARRGRRGRGEKCAEQGNHRQAQHSDGDTQTVGESGGHGGGGRRDRDHDDSGEG